MKGRKGQVTFEFIVVLSAVIFLTTVIMNDFFNESSDTFVLNSVKTATLQSISQKVLTDPSCSNTVLRSMSIEESDARTIVSLEIKGCASSLSLIEIADYVEKEFCGVRIPDSNIVISCGGKSYELRLV